MAQQRDAGARVVSKDTDMGEGPHFHAASKQKRNLVGVIDSAGCVQSCESETTGAPLGLHAIPTVILMSMVKSL